MLPPASSSTTFSRPFVHSPASARWFRRKSSGRASARFSLRAEPRYVSGVRRLSPVGLRLHAEPFDGHELALDAEQPLDEALRLLVTPFAQVLVADDAVRVDEVERRPSIVVESAPDVVVVVERDRVVDRSLLRGLPHALDLVLERELRRVDADHDQPVVSVRLRPRPNVRLLPEPVDAGQCPEVEKDDPALELGGAEWLAVEPPGRPAERRHADTAEHRHLTNSRRIGHAAHEESPFVLSDL